MAKSEPLNSVAAFARNDVDAHAAGGLVGRARREIDRHFLHAAHVGQEVAGLAGSSELAVDSPSIITRWSLPLLPWMVMLPPVVLMMLVPPTSWLFRFMPGISVAAVNCVRPVGIDRSTSSPMTRCLVALCTSTIGDSPVTVTVSSTRADPQLGVDRRGERSGQLDAFAPDGAEAGERERHRVGAGPQLLDPVLAGAVGDHRADLLDQRRARRFDRHAGQHRARRVADDAGDRGLRRLTERKRPAHPPAPRSTIAIRASQRLCPGYRARVLGWSHFVPWPRSARRSNRCIERLLERLNPTRVIDQFQPQGHTVFGYVSGPSRVRVTRQSDFE